MYVSIDMDNLCILHKHHDHETVSALSFLEAPQYSVCTSNTEAPHFLLNLTALDIRMLYKNTTGQDITGTDDLTAREMMAQVIETLVAPTLALTTEVNAQVLAVEDDLYNGIPWKYALGAKKPAKPLELFPLTAPPLDPHRAQIAATMAPQRRTVRGAAVVAETVAPPPAAGSAPKQRASSVRPTIWAEADKLWQAAGSPTDIPVVLALRKQMMAHLEEHHGVKKTSSSNELGNWMKARLG